MWSRYLYYILQFRWIMTGSLVLMLVMAAALLTMLKTFSFGRKRNLVVITLFFNMKKRHRVYLAANCLTLGFVLSALVFAQDMQIAYLVYLLLLAAVAGVSVGSPVELIRSMVGAVLIYAAFFLIDVLKNYMYQIIFDVRIAVICVLLCVFMVFFAIYFFLPRGKIHSSRKINSRGVMNGK